MGEAYVDTIIRYFQEVSLWFEEDLGSEAVSWYDVAHVHDHTPLPVPLCRYLGIFGTQGATCLLHWRQLRQHVVGSHQVAFQRDAQQQQLR